jgi:predicted amidohydrolase YtcJ
MTSPPRADLIIEGRVATLAGTAGWGWAEGLAIAGGRIVGAGSPAELELFAGDRTERWRLAPDLLVMPGITDAHVHLLSLALARLQVDLTAQPDLPSTLTALAAAHARLLENGDADGWLLGHGWSLDRLGAWPDAAMLATACPGRPVALYSHDHHTRWVSRRALELAGIDEGTADPADGSLRRDGEGRLTGMLHEGAAALVEPAIPEPSDELLEKLLTAQASELFGFGITGCHDPGELAASSRIRRGPLFYRRLAELGRLPLRVHASIRAAELDHAIELGLRSGVGVGRYRMGWLKLFADGSLGSRSAALLAPYDDAPTRPPTGGPRGMFLDPPAEIAALLARAAAAGISGQVHAIGDAAVRAVLDVLAVTPPGPLPARIEHAQLVDPADVARFGALGVAASVQPVHLRSDAEVQRLAWGARSESSFPLVGLVSGGALIPFGTDAPVEPVDPWPGLAVAVSRRDPLRPDARPTAPEQALDLARAVRAACLDPALVAQQHDLGRLLPGCRADLIVVPAAGLREPVDPLELARTRPLATLIEGEVVFRAAGFDPLAPTSAAAPAPTLG